MARPKKAVNELMDDEIKLYLNARDGRTLDMIARIRRQSKSGAAREMLAKEMDRLEAILRQGGKI